MDHNRSTSSPPEKEEQLDHGSVPGESPEVDANAASKVLQVPTQTTPKQSNVQEKEPELSGTRSSTGKEQEEKKKSHSLPVFSETVMPHHHHNVKETTGSNAEIINPKDNAVASLTEDATTTMDVASSRRESENTNNNTVVDHHGTTTTNNDVTTTTGDDGSIPDMPVLRRSSARRRSSSTPGAVAVHGTGTTDLEDPVRNPTSSTRSNSGEDETLIEAELVKDAALVVAEPAPPHRPIWVVLCFIGGLVLVVLVTVVVLLTRNNDGSPTSSSNNNTTTTIRSPTYTESLQWGNTLDGDHPDDLWGAHLALSADGTILATGARNDGQAQYGGTMRSGEVRVFSATTTIVKSNSSSEKDSVVWSSYGNAIVGQTAWSYGVSVLSGEYGLAMSASGHRIVVGTPWDNGTVPTTGRQIQKAGRARIFEFEESTQRWVQLGNTLMDDDQFEETFNVRNNRFGASTSMNDDGTIVAVGSGSDSSHVRIFQEHELDNSTGVHWKQIGQTLGGKEVALNDKFGRSLALSASGLVIAVGASQRGVRNPGPGYAQVFAFNGTRWNQVGQKMVGDNDSDNFGRTVSLSSDGTILAVGANMGTTNAAYGKSGLVRIYKMTPGSTVWELTGELGGIAENDEFGISVDLADEGSRLAVGAYQKFKSGQDNETMGYVQIFDYDANLKAWKQSGSKLRGSTPAEAFGAQVKLSADGLLLAVGATSGDTINGLDSGHTQVFDLSSL